MEKIRVIIFANQESDRRNLSLFLKTMPDLEVIGEASDGLEINDLVNSRALNILVFYLTRVDEIEILRKENQYRPDIKSIAIYNDNGSNNIHEMLRSGAKAYISSECVPTELPVAIREVMAGRKYLSSPLFEHAIENYIKKEPHVSNTPNELLTKREFEVFNLVVKGWTSAQIGKSLSISRRTVEIHRANILRKLNLASQYKQIKNYAMGLGIVNPANVT